MTVPLSDVQKQTINLIQELHEQQGLSYKEITLDKIRQARVAASMAPGSQGDLVKLKHLWAELNGIDKQNAKYSSETKDKLIGRVIDSLEGEFKQIYETKASTAIAKSKELQEAAKYELSQLKTEFEKLKQANVEQTAAIIERDCAIEELQLERDSILEDKRTIDKESSNLRLKLVSAEKTNRQYETQQKQQLKAYDELRADMENQRHTQMKLLDDRKQEVKHAEKEIQKLRQQLQQKEQQMHAVEKKLAVVEQKYELLASDTKQHVREYKTLEQSTKQLTHEYNKEKSALLKTITKLEGQLEQAQKNQSQFNVELLSQLKALQPKPVKKSKGKVKK